MQFKTMKKCNEIKLVVSDFHIGEGHGRGRVNQYDDFHYDNEFKELIAHYTSNDYEQMPVELIINGDFFDFLKVRYDGKFVDVITENAGVAKLKTCFKGHPIIRETLSNFIKNENHFITVIPGNHDMELVFFAVERCFRDMIAYDDASKARIKFIDDKDVYHVRGGVQIHHGHQFELLNAFDYDQLKFIQEGKEPTLNLPWGSLFVITIVNRFKRECPSIDQVRPFRLFMARMLILDPLLTVKVMSWISYYFVRTRFLQFWERRRNRFAKTLKFLTGGFSFKSSLEQDADEILNYVSDTNVIIFGHNHTPKYRVFENNKTYINTGTWTRAINLDVREFTRYPKLTFALLEYGDDKKISNSSLLEWKGPYHEIEIVNY